MNFLSKIENLSKPYKILLGYTMIVVIGILDLISGFEIAFSIFYTIPVSFVTWNSGN